VSVCFLMMTSLVVESLPPMHRNPSEERNHLNFSYQSRVRFVFLVSIFCSAASCLCSSV